MQLIITHLSLLLKITNIIAQDILKEFLLSKEFEILLSNLDNNISIFPKVIINSFSYV